MGTLEDRQRAVELMAYVQPLMEVEDFYFVEASADVEDWLEVIELCEEYLDRHPQPRSV